MIKKSTTLNKTTKNKSKAAEKEKILLMGNPNVGKSVVFTKLSGVHADSSNYVGTTVSYTYADIELGAQKYQLVDVPGTYSLDATCEAEQVAIDFLNDGAKAIICVLDATNIERNIHFALQIKKYGIPTIFVLNLSDVAERQGIIIDEQKLEEELLAKVIKAVAVKGIGIDSIREELCTILNPTISPCGKNCNTCPFADKSNLQLRDNAKEISKKVKSRQKVDPSFTDKLGEAMIKPFIGSIIAILALTASIYAVIGGGEFLIGNVFEPLVGVITNFFSEQIPKFVTNQFFQDVLVGEFGILIISFEWIIASILPYVFMFYAVFSFLEDCGYLPRLGVLFDNIMSKMGLQGGSIITILLGYGCAVPAIIGSRAATTKKERLIIATIVCFAVPCTSQSGALLSLFAKQPIWMLGLLYLLSFAVMVVVSLILSKTLKGKTQPMLIEIPNLLLPNGKAYLSKLTLRMKHFFLEAEFPMLIAIVLISVISATNVLDSFSKFMAPLVVGWLGLPPEAAVALLTGIIRREMSVAPLLALDLNSLQMFVGATVSLLYLPCLSVFAVLVKEFNLKTALFIGFSTTATAFLLAGLINQIGRLFI